MREWDSRPDDVASVARSTGRRATPRSVALDLAAHAGEESPVARERSQGLGVAEPLNEWFTLAVSCAIVQCVQVSQDLTPKALRSE